MLDLMSAGRKSFSAPRVAAEEQRQARSAKEEPIAVQGTITQVLPKTMFRVALANGHVVLAHVAGNIRKHFIRISVGDTVEMQMSPYDLTKARITYRR
jgi:translation initiation factor IF-1